MNITYQAVDMFLAGLYTCCPLQPKDVDPCKLQIMDQLTELMMPGVCPPPGRHELILQSTCPGCGEHCSVERSVLVGDDGSLRV